MMLIFTEALGGRLGGWVDISQERLPAGSDDAWADSIGIE